MTQTPRDDRPADPPRAARPPGWGLVAALAAALAVALVAVGVLATLLVVRTGDRDAPRALEEPTASSDADEPPAADGAPLDGPLAFAPPELEDPETVQVTEDDRSVSLDEGQDYVLELPDRPLVGGLSISGGDDVVLIGGEITVPPSDDEDARGRGLGLGSQTGVVHVEGLAITGDGLKEGINLNQREGAVVQLQNIRLDTVQGARDSNHADVLQTWAGPRVLRVDRLSASTTYQGFFLLPQQFGDQDEPEEFDLRHVDITGLDGSAYLLWRDRASWPLRLSDVWLSREGGTDEDDGMVWPEGDGDGTEAWGDVERGTPPGGPFVPEGVAGVGYTSPGYAD